VTARIGILGLQGDVAEHARALMSVGADPVVVRSAQDLAGVSGLVIPGGESTTISQLAVTLALLAPIRDAIAAGLPAFGTCAGMIMLANEVLDGRPDQEQFGGLDITVRRNAFGRQVDSFESPVVVAGVPGSSFPGVFIRAPWVERVGPDVEVLAQVPGPRPSERGLSVGNQSNLPPTGGVGTELVPRDTLGGGDRIVTVRQGSVLATAFHPEITHDDRLHALFLTMV